VLWFIRLFVLRLLRFGSLFGSLLFNRCRCSGLLFCCSCSLYWLRCFIDFVTLLLIVWTLLLLRLRGYCCSVRYVPVMIGSGSFVVFGDRVPFRLRFDLRYRVLRLPLRFGCLVRYWFVVRWFAVLFIRFISC